MDKGGKQKLFYFEVDQSIRIENISDDSFVAIANEEIFYTLKIDKKVKRSIFEYYRCKGNLKFFAPQLFAAVIILGMRKSCLRFIDLGLDMEYPGYERTIIKLIKQNFLDVHIEFKKIGKKSMAHFAAYGAFKGKRKINIQSDINELLTILNIKK